MRGAVRAVLDNPSHAAAAKKIAGDIAAMPGPDEIARMLQERYG